MKRIESPDRLQRAAPCRLILALVAVLGAGSLFSSLPLLAQSSETVCSRIGADDTIRPLPAELIPAARRLFDLDGSVSASYVRASTFFRCEQGRILLCNVGANLHCGKADTTRSIPEADAYCRENPAAMGVPMSVTGHATIYEWSCEGDQAKAGAEIAATDNRGFIAENWKRLD